MSKKIHLESIEALPQFDAALKKFCTDVSERLDSAERIMEARQEWIEECCNNYERQVSYWEEQYYNADDEYDDVSYLAYKRDEAIEKLSHARRLQSYVGEVSDNLGWAIRRVKDIVDGGQLAEASSFIREKVEKLESYTNLKVGGITDFPNSFSTESGPIANLITENTDKLMKDLDTVAFDDETTERLIRESVEVGGISNIRTLFGSIAAHPRWEEKIKNFDELRGRTCRDQNHPNGEFGIEYRLEYSEGEVRYDYVDFEEHVIIDLKPIRAGQTVKDIEKNSKYREEKRRHIKAYEENFGVTPRYEYDTYLSTKDVDLKEGETGLSPKEGE